MKARFAAITWLVLCVYLAVPAMVIRNLTDEGEDGIRTETVAYDEDYLFLGHELHFSGGAEDLIFLGNELEFSGATELALIALGEKVLYSGKSGNGVFAGCMNMIVDGAVTGNSFVGCKSFHLSEVGTIGGNLFVGCAKLLIDGAITGDLYAGAGEITINGTVEGNVVAYGGRVVIGDNGRITGNLTYSAKEKLSEDELTRIGGTVTLKEEHAWDWDHMFPAKAKRWLGFLIGLAFFVSFVVVGSLLLFLPVFKALDEKRSPREYWRTALWGLIPVLMYPAIIVLSLALVVTIPFAVVLLLASIPLLFGAYIIGTTLTGQFIVGKFNWKIEKRHYCFLIGALAVGLISAIPFVDFLVFVFVTALGAGVFLSFLFQRNLAAAQ